MQQSQNLSGLTHAGRCIAPTGNDVLFGRGKRFQNHPGNLRMRKIIRKYKKIYMAQKGQHKKRLVVENAYNEIVSGGARFVKQSEENKNDWVEVMMHEALEKVAHTIRYKPRNAKEGGSAKEGDNEEECSADEKPVNMAANTVVLTRDQPASSLSAHHVQALSAVEPAPGPSSYGSQVAAPSQAFTNPLLNPNISQQQVNQIVPPISLLDVYVNPINRPFLQAGLLSPTNYPQNLLLNGLGFNRYGLNQATPNPYLASALGMNQANAAAGQQAMLAQMQQAVQDADKNPQGRAFPNDNKEEADKAEAG
eukprot:CAMPEP_0113624180 /NCGR_PEP_ID=MMETSP0017_2-20120614/12461_1 /TAXON_ID=2856 /ORGANISM="Cylindrotheca closterium" /LENGTH=307 /DNA_ID=CAMNT_0000534195 /DNA_START=55 /DNA_END=978 /DNA_ORIENTATION=- /assembly_acc=CAM_ASM_000147